MSKAVGPSIQSISDGRLTLKKAHLEYLGNPSEVDITFGPGLTILLHQPAIREELVKRLLGSSDEGPLDSDQMEVEFRLESVAEACPVDEQGRLRIPTMHLKRAGLEGKGSQAYLWPRPRSGWLEIASQEEYSRVADHTNDSETSEDFWMKALNRVIERRRQERDHASGQDA